MSALVNLVGFLFWVWLAGESGFAFILTQALWLAVVSICSFGVVILLVVSYVRHLSSDSV